MTRCFDLGCNGCDECSDYGAENEPRARWPAELRIPLRELVAGKAEVRRIEEAMKSPPCVECGAMTADEAGTRCCCAGDKDDCHGCRLWPDA